MKITQSLIKDLERDDICPRYLKFKYLDKIEVGEPTEAMKLGLFFESELLGSARGGRFEGEKYSKPYQQYKAGDLKKPYRDVLEVVEFARDVMRRLEIAIFDEGVQVELEYGDIVAHIDLISGDIYDPDGTAIYDVKYTGISINDKWNPWNDVESNTDAITQSRHYVYAWYKKYGNIIPFYFLIFGSNPNKWVKVVRLIFSPEDLNRYLDYGIGLTTVQLTEMEENEWKGNGNLNKCSSCSYNNICPDASTRIDIEEIFI